MKKLIAFVCAAVLTVSTAVTALAQPSVTVTGVVTGTQTATDKNGNTVTVEIQEVPEEYADAVAEVKTAEKLKELLGDAYTEGMEVVDVKDITVPEGTEFPVTITFTVTGVTETSKVAVLHYDTTAKKWEKVESKAGNGTITATFTSLSPVAFVVDKNTVSSSSSTTAGSTSTSGSTSGTTSPKTGEANVMMWAGMVAVAALAGMAVTYRRRKDA